MDRVNEMFGTSIQVSLDSSWLENEIERLLSLRQQASEASSQLDNPAPLEAGLGEVSIEGASMEGVGMEMDNGVEEDGEEVIDETEESEEDLLEESEEEGSSELDEVSGDDTGSSDGTSVEESGEDVTVEVNVNVNAGEEDTEDEESED